MVMKRIESTNTSDKWRRDITDSFGKKLPLKYQWSRVGTTWYLSGPGVEIIAKIIDKNERRIVYLEDSVFKTKKLYKNPKKENRQFPPPFKPSKRLLAKIIDKFDIHPELIDNPDPPDCPTCGLKYKDMKTGFDFRSIQDMLFVDSNDPKHWRHKGRHSVLGLWYEIKRSMWRDHLGMCQDPKGQEDYFKDWSESDFEY